MTESPARPEPSHLELFGSRTDIAIRAMFLGDRLDTAAFRESERVGVSPLVIRHGQGLVVMFRYGAVVMFGIEPLEQASLLRQLREFVATPFSEPEQEQLALRVTPDADDRPEGATIGLKSLSVERIQVVADVLAKSVVLAHHEEAVAKVFERVEPLATSMERGTIKNSGGKVLLSHIGSALRVQTQMVARVGVTDKPDLLWERPGLELLYARLEDEFELSERHTALERKLALVSQTAETLLEVLQHRHTLRVEWYIVLLIILEIMLSLYSMFGPGH